MTKVIRVTLLFSVLILILALSGGAGDYDFRGALAQTVSPDAIAVRVYPNLDHFSAKRWYQGQGFTGSPQSIVVDGYEGVRDGRTVYVNVANVNADSLYTNIYLISYNQEAENVTQDIFSRILANWKFNTNVSLLGHCRKANSHICTYDNDCPIGDSCDSAKGRVIRDTKRLSDLTGIESVLNGYHTSGGHYPKLAAGTYLPHWTLSVWPSWRDTFTSEVGGNIPVDPVNRLGPCPNYDEITCWDDNAKRFVTTLPDLPDSSLVYQYYTDTNGVYPHLCAVFESGFGITGKNLAGSCPGICLDFDGDGYGNPASSACPHSELDCDDTDPAKTFPTGAEVCGNSLDDDCDGAIDCGDADCAGDPACSTAGTCNFNSVCDAGETCLSCPADGCCGPPTCPDGFCDTSCECPSGPSACPSDCRCGNGTTECGEQCDDGNTVSGDGCSSGCLLEAASCADADGDTYDNCHIGTFGDDGKPWDCNDGNAAVNPGAPEICNSLDDNCNGSADEGLTADGCGFVCLALSSTYDYNASRVGNLRCCGDDAGEGNPYEANELTCDGVSDNDCDGKADPVDPDCTGTCGNSSEDDWYVFGQADCHQCDHIGDDDGNQTTPPQVWNSPMADQCDAACGTVSATVRLDDYGAEICDGIDNDCNGTIDDGLGATTCGVGACQNTVNNCVGGVPQVCTPLPPPSPIEFCGDGIDNDCNGIVDDGCGNCYHDGDGDGYGDPADMVVAAGCPPNYVADNSDCNDGDASIHPGATEICDGIDNGCSGALDGSGEIPPDIDAIYQHGVCLDAKKACIAGAWNNNLGSIFGYESPEATCDDTDISGNPIDNDCDGDANCADLDCSVACGCSFTITFPCSFPGAPSSPPSPPSLPSSPS